MQEPILPYNYKQEVYNRLNSIESILPELKRILLELQDEHLDIQYKSSDVDIVTKADYLSEQTIIHFLQSKFPQDSILSEESGMQEAIIKNLPSINIKESKFTWCIDPLDGTVNYAHKLPLFSISFGILYENFPIGGLVYLPVFNDIYRAVYKDGAYKNHKPIRTSNQKSLKESLVVTGFPYNKTQIVELLANTIKKILSHTRGLRRTGSASLDLCWVAEGRFDGHYEWNLSPWDTCAGTVIVREAGGLISNEKKQNYTPGDSLLIASNPYIHQSLVNLILEDTNPFLSK